MTNSIINTESMLANFLIVKDGNKKNITIRSGKHANIANLNRAKNSIRKERDSNPRYDFWVV